MLSMAVSGVLSSDGDASNESARSCRASPLTVQQLCKRTQKHTKTSKNKHTHTHTHRDRDV